MRLPLLLASLAQAAFYPPGDIPEKPRDWGRVQAAVHRVSMDTGASCSGAFVSPDGYFLTALHCLETCLAQAGKPLAPAGEEGFYSVTEPPAGAAGLRCPDYSSAYALSDVEARTPRVVWLGKGSETFDDGRIEELSPAVLVRLAAHADDYAVLKYDLPGPVPCLPLGADPRPGDAAWGLGYPAWTSRPDGHNSAGIHVPHASTGRVLASIRDDAYLPGVIRSEEGWRREGRVFDQPQVLLATVDSNHGASGEPLVDARGELVGVLYSSVKTSPDKELDDAAITIRASHILSEVRRALGADTAKRVFSCPRTLPGADLSAARAALEAAGAN